MQFHFFAYLSIIIFPLCSVLCSVTHSCPTLCDSMAGLQSIRLLCPQDFPGKNTGVGCRILLQWIFLLPASPALQVGSSLWRHLGSPARSYKIPTPFFHELSYCICFLGFCSLLAIPRTPKHVPSVGICSQTSLCQEHISPAIHIQDSVHSHRESFSDPLI